MAAVTFTSDWGAVYKNLGFAGTPGAIFISGSFAFDASYPTNGESFVDSASNKIAAFLPKGQVKLVLFEQKAGYVFEYDYTNDKVKAYYADYNAAADGALIEVPNTTDLSALTDVRWIAWGY